MQITFKFLDIDSGSFLRENDTSFNLSTFDDTESSEFETKSASAALKILKTKDDDIPSWGIPSLRSVDGDVKCVAVKSEFSTLGSSSNPILVGTELFEVEFDDVKNFDYIGKRACGSMPLPLLRRYVPADILSDVDPSKCIFVVVDGDRANPAVGDFTIGQHFMDDAIAQIAHAQPLPDEWPHEDSMNGKENLLLLFLDCGGSNLPYRLSPLARKRDMNGPTYRV